MWSPTTSGSAVFTSPPILRQRKCRADSKHPEKLPGTTSPVYLSGDANAPIRWSEEGPTCYGQGSKGNALLDTLLARGLHVLPPKGHQLNQAMSRPRQENAKGRAIDWVAVKNADCKDVEKRTDPSYDLGTDHDCFVCKFHLPQPLGVKKRIQSGRRVLRSTPVLTESINQATFQNLR